MADTWAAMILTAGTAVLAGQGPWRRYQRRQHHARVAARRLQRDGQADLTRLDDRNRVLQEQVHRSLGPECAPDSLFGPDLIGDFHRLVIAELLVWADEAAKELERLSGRRLEARRQALRKLRTEIRALCAEIEEREAVWATVEVVAPTVPALVTVPPTGPLPSA
jgi:hypothetical protein